MDANCVCPKTSATGAGDRPNSNALNGFRRVAQYVVLQRETEGLLAEAVAACRQEGLPSSNKIRHGRRCRRGCSRAPGIRREAGPVPGT
jgi:hypothetical protein